MTSPMSQFTTNRRTSFVRSPHHMKRYVTSSARLYSATASRKLVASGQVCISVIPTSRFDGLLLRIVLCVVDLKLPRRQLGEKLLEGRSPQREEVTSCWKLAPRCWKLVCTPPCFHTTASEFLPLLLGCFPSHVVEQERDRHGSHRFHQRAQSGRRRWAHGLFACAQHRRQ